MARKQDKQQWQDLPQFLADQQKQGVRGFVLGEMHSSQVLPDMLQQQMAQYYAKGLRTLYVEFVAADEQRLLESALKGDPAAQKQLRQQFAHSWGEAGRRDELAQARYDLLFAAHKAGLRVIGVDTSDHDAHKTFDMAKREYNAEARVKIGNQHMADQIKKNDDGKPFLVIAGGAHTSRPLPKDNLSGPWPMPKEGGIEAQLRAKGIKSVSLDLSEGASALRSGKVAIASTSSAESDFTLTTPPEPPEQNRRNTAMSRLGYLQNVERKAQRLADPSYASGADRKTATQFAQNMRAVTQAFNDCLGRVEMSPLIERAVRSGTPLVGTLKDEREDDRLRLMLNRLKNMNTEGVIADNATQCRDPKPELWKRDSKPLKRD